MTNIAWSYVTIAVASPEACREQISSGRNASTFIKGNRRGTSSKECVAFNSIEGPRTGQPSRARNGHKLKLKATIDSCLLLPVELAGGQRIGEGWFGRFLISHDRLYGTPRPCLPGGGEARKGWLGYTFISCLCSKPSHLVFLVAFNVGCERQVENTASHASIIYSIATPTT